MELFIESTSLPTKRRSRKGLGGHHSAAMMNDEWLTPPSLLKKMGAFDLDPCAPAVRPWDTASNHFCKEQDGLNQIWTGRVWCNPPYGSMGAEWLDRCAEHGNCTSLIFARTETEMFFNHVWDRATALLFIKGRLYFHYVDGTRAKANSGAPSVLVAYDTQNAALLMASGIPGKFIHLR